MQGFIKPGVNAFLLVKGVKDKNPLGLFSIHPKYRVGEEQQDKRELNADDCGSDEAEFPLREESQTVTSTVPNLARGCCGSIINNQSGKEEVQL
jgi:hypothetical protein